MAKSIVGFALLVSLTICLYVPAVAAQGAAPSNQSLPDAPKPQPRAVAPTPAQASAPSSANSPFKTQEERYSYALGLILGGNLKKQAMDLDLTVLDQGIKDGLAGGKTLMTEDEVKATMTQFQNDSKLKREEMARMAASRNKENGEAFLAANKGKPGVVVLPSGLQYKVMTEGTGPKPTAADTVNCNYRGTLIDGTEFDSSEKHGGPATFPVSRVIKGWTEALQLMPVGSKWQLFVPANLAYGERGAGADIGPNATLIFEVELVSIQGKQ